MSIDQRAVIVVESRDRRGTDRFDQVERCYQVVAPLMIFLSHPHRDSACHLAKTFPVR